MLGDGCIEDRRKTSNMRIMLRLKASDIEHIEKFRAFVGHQGKIYMQSISSKVTKNRINPTCSVNITSTPMALDLINIWGVTPNKRFNAKVCKNMEDNIDFWRGLIDSDGSLFYKKVHKTIRPAINITGTRAICESFIRFAGAYFIAEAKPYSDGNSFQVMFAGNKILPLIGGLYGNAEVYLARKHALAQKFIQEFA